MWYQPNSEPYGSESYHGSIWCFLTIKICNFKKQKDVQIWLNKSFFFFLHHFWGSEAALLSIMQIMAMAAARAHTRETRATFIKFSTIQTLHVSMHPALKAAPGLLGLSCPRTWRSNTSEEAGNVRDRCTALLLWGREVNAQCGQSWGLCCTGHQWTSKYHVGELVTLWTKLFFVTFYCNLMSPWCKRIKKSVFMSM